MRWRDVTQQRRIERAGSEAGFEEVYFRPLGQKRIGVRDDLGSQFRWRSKLAEPIPFGLGLDGVQPLLKFEARAFACVLSHPGLISSLPEMNANLEIRIAHVKAISKFRVPTLSFINVLLKIAHCISVSGREGLFSLVILIRNRSASFTDSASGNTSTISGSKRTTDPPRVFRSGPSLLTRKLLRSYSGLSSSSISVSTFFMYFLIPFKLHGRIIPFILAGPAVFTFSSFASLSCVFLGALPPSETLARGLLT